MATAQQVANKIKQRQVDAINQELEDISKTLRKYEPLFELRRQLEAARRALLNERAPTAGGGRGLTQDEIVNALGGEKLTVHESCGSCAIRRRRTMRMRRMTSEV
jgi:hypothetical protein